MIGTLTRKALRHPDNFVTAIRNAFIGVIGHTRGLVITLGSLLLVAILGVLFLNHRTTRANASRNAYYLAEKELSVEVKALEKSLPAPSAPKNAQEPTEDLSAFQKIDVNQKFPQGIQKLKAVYEQFSGTRAQYDSAVQLGDLYFNHRDFNSARTWYEHAVKAAPSSLEEALALSSLGYTHENLSQPAAAISFLQKALNLGEASLKGDLLLSMARCYEAIHDGAKARSTYEQVLSDLPGTDWAKSAEIFKAQLH